MRCLDKVTLSWLEISVASKVGCLRRLTSIREGMKDRAGRSQDFTNDILGATGEMAFAKAAGIYWEPTNKTFSVPDVGIFEVKTSSSDDDCGVEIGTPDDRIVVGVSGSIPSFKIMGWITGKEAKSFEPTVKKYRPTHWVPAGRMRKFEDLYLDRAVDEAAQVAYTALAGERTI